MIHHFSIAAHNPATVATFIAELWQTEALPFPMYENSYIVFADDGAGTGIEIYPGDTELYPDLPELPRLTPVARDSMHSPFNAAISVPLSEQQVLDLSAFNGWTAKTAQRGPFFQVVEIWIEGHTLLEVLTKEWTAAYEQVSSTQSWKQAFGLV